MANQAKNPVKSIHKAFGIIETLVDLDGAGVTEIAENVNEPKSTVHNYLSTLEEVEYVYRSGTEYYVGIRFLELGVQARRRYPLFTAGRDQVRELANQSGEFGNIVIEEYGYGTTIYWVRGDNSVKFRHMGVRSYLHRTAVGKSILANLPEERVYEIVEMRGLPKSTPKTITTEEELFEQLSLIREQGFAYDDEEVQLGQRCVAAPVISAQDELLGAISVSGPKTRLKGDYYWKQLPELVLESSNIIALNLAAME